MDEMVKIPMNEELNFMTLSIITPIVVYEFWRQQKALNEKGYFGK